MRTDFCYLAEWLPKAEPDSWTEADVAEMGEGIKKAIDSGNQQIVTCWAEWLKEKADRARTFAASVRNMEQRIKREAKVEV